MSLLRLDDYMRELHKIALLSPEEEAALWCAFKEQGDAKARQRIIQAYQPLVFKSAMPYRALDAIMDIIQEGTVGLIEAVEHYEHRRGVAFSLFAVHRIRGRILNFLRKEGAVALASLEADGASAGLSAKDCLVDPGASVAEQAEAHELSLRLREALARLPQKERLVLEEVFIGSAAVGDVAVRLNVSPSHIYRLQKTAIRRIRGMLSRFMQRWGGD